MRFMVLVPGSPESEAGEMPSTELLGDVEIELREIFEAGDFGEQLTPELRQANERLREQAAHN
jgi:hypothetical protein